MAIFIKNAFLKSLKISKAQRLSSRATSASGIKKYLNSSTINAKIKTKKNKAKFCLYNIVI